MIYIGNEAWFSSLCAVSIGIPYVVSSFFQMPLALVVGKHVGIYQIYNKSGSSY